MEMKHKEAVTQSVKKVSLVTGTILVSLGFVLLVEFDVIHEMIIKSALDFQPGSESYKAWITNDPPLVINFYMFNFTNAEECLIKLNCEKFKFEEVGPYPFYEVTEKVNVTWHPNNTVSYKFVKRYLFINDENNPRKLTDKVTNVNPVALSFAYQHRHGNLVGKFSANLVLFLAELITTKTVEEFFFEGFSDHILQVGSVFRDLPKRFGFFYQKNNSVSANEMLMHTGLDQDFGKLLAVNGRNTTDFFPGRCGNVRGSAGEFLPMYSNRDYIEIYSSELCSFARLDYERNVTMKGIHSYKYGSKSLFDNGTLHPENSCFCQGECPPTGIQNVSLCKMMSPIFLSLPHFYNADPYYLSSIEGLHPDKNKHEVQVTIEPKSSILLNLSLRMQINILLQPVEKLSFFHNVPKLYVPLFYFDQTFTLADKVLEKIKFVQELPNAARICSVWMIITGCAMIGVAILLYVFVKPMKEDSMLELKKASGR